METREKFVILEATGPTDVGNTEGVDDCSARYFRNVILSLIGRLVHQVSLSIPADRRLAHA
jgi:hypothetical protein